MPEVTVSKLDDGALWRITFSNGKGNILDCETMTQLAAVFRQARTDALLKAICLEGAGRHFSFGASVPEHLPSSVEGMFAAFNDLAFAMLESDVFTIAAVRGQCLGGGLEVVTLCHRVIGDVDAMFAQPEIVLGVFAPIASIALVDRIGRANAEDLCVTGRSIDVGVAHGMGLVQAVDEHPADAAIAWAREAFAARSASSLRHAVRAIRADLTRRLRTELPALETQYLEQLMKTADAVEGLTAFVEKRPAVWRHA
ncbi:MAG: enoyl-CoA hydratase/isomerase family protein [Acidobacteria bacterium]|nr:enoyl-CoA hydratase/isomerase family protein [Acidobacteriota bacterium]